MNTMNAVQELKSERVLEPVVAARKRVARPAGLPLRASVNGNTIQIAVSGSVKRAEGVSEAVLDLAEQLG